MVMMGKKMKKENCTVSIPKGNSFVIWMTVHQHIREGNTLSIKTYKNVFAQKQTVTAQISVETYFKTDDKKME